VGFAAGCTALVVLAGCAGQAAGVEAASDPSASAADLRRAEQDAAGKADRVVQRIEADYVWQADGYAHSAAQVGGVEVMLRAAARRDR
jgi:hypothetical protein